MLKRIMLLGVIVLFMTGTLSTEAATKQSSAALEPWTTGVIDQATGVYLGQHVSIDHYKYNGRAYISYYDNTYGDLKLAYQVSPGTGNCPGNVNWKCETIDDNTNDVGRYSSIDVFEATLIRSSGLVFHYAKIGISYYDNIAKSLKYAQQSCREGILGLIRCEWSITTVDDDPSSNWPHNIGQYTSFQFNTAGTPVIYYHGESGTNDNIGYVKRAILTGSVIGNCDDGWQCEVVARSTANRAYGTHISADGNTVAFFDYPQYKLVLARRIPQVSNTCGMSNNWDCVEVDSDVGRFVSLVADGVHPTQMVYYDAFGGKIKHAIASSGSGNCGGGSYNCYTVDTIGVAVVETGIGLSMTLDAEGEPIIAYQDFSEQQSPAALKIARPYYVYGKPVGNCGDALIGIITFWQCDYLDGGGSYLNEADYAAVSVSPAGLATVAYYETDDYYNLGRLKVAQEQQQQHFTVHVPLIMK
jgi:hypothetical protein